MFTKKPQNDYASSESPKLNGSARSPVAAYQTGGKGTRSVIDAWLTITGDLMSEGEVQVEGHVNGDIRCAHLTVGKDAKISGNIIAEEVVVRGRVTGIIRALRVILQDSAHVDSEIYHRSLAVEEGACFEGASRRRDEPMQVESTRTAEKAPIDSEENARLAVVA
jgi:cytoskeletal protein CcmA (bactofilin family)